LKRGAALPQRQTAAEFWIKAPGQDTFLIVFNDEALCQALMAGQPKR
jgi:hypothetical protein